MIPGTLTTHNKTRQIRSDLPGFFYFMVSV